MTSGSPRSYDSYKREDSMEENLRRMVEGFCEITYKFKSEFKAYREAEFTNVVETAKFHGIFLNFISKTIGKKAKKEDLVHFWFIIGPLLYLSIYWVLWNDKKVPDSDIEGLIDFYLNGISPEKYEFVFSDLSLNDNDKSNEITAIPQLLEIIDVEDAIVTIDAAGCQKNIAAQIVQGKGDFVPDLTSYSGSSEQAQAGNAIAHQNDGQNVPPCRLKNTNTSSVVTR